MFQVERTPARGRRAAAGGAGGPKVGSHYLGALQDMHGGGEERVQQALGRQRYADELRAQMGEKQRRRDREKVEQKERQRREWEEEMQLLSERREAARPGRRSKEEIERAQAEGEPGISGASPGREGLKAFSLLEPSPRFAPSPLKERARVGAGAAADPSFSESPLQQWAGAAKSPAPRGGGANPYLRNAAPSLRAQQLPHNAPAAKLPAVATSPMARFAMGEPNASPVGLPARGTGAVGGSERGGAKEAPLHGRRAEAVPRSDVWTDPADDSALGSLARLRKDLMVEYQMLGGRLQNLNGKAVFSGARAKPPGGRVRPWEPGGMGPGAAQKFDVSGRRRGQDAGSVWEAQKTEWVFPSLTDGDFEDHDSEWRANGGISPGDTGGGVAGAVRAQQVRPLSRMWDRADLGEDQLDKWLAGFVEHDVGRLDRAAPDPGRFDAAAGRLASPNPALEAESTFLMPC